MIYPKGTKVITERGNGIVRGFKFTATDGNCYLIELSDGSRIWMTEKSIHPNKKKRGKTIILSILIFIVGVFVIAGIEGSHEVKNLDDGAVPTSVPTSSTSLKEFDAKTWEQFKILYDAHNNLMDAMYAYGDGKINTLDFYNYCKEAEEYFRNISTKFGYGSSAYEKKYLSVFRNWALYDQLVAKNLMKYLDTYEIKYLSTAEEYIQLASDAAVTIASNRAKLLKDAGYTSEEIQEIIDNIPNELEN